MDISSDTSNNLLRSTGLTTVDTDSQETQDWLDALESVMRVAGPERALALLRLVEEQAQQPGIIANVPTYSAYGNSIPVDQEAPYPGDLEIEERITSIIRWNALAMVVRANRGQGDLGGQIRSYAFGGSSQEILSEQFNR